MEIVFSTGNEGKDDRKIREELLEHLKGFEEEGWFLLGVRHMNLKKRKWLTKSEKLTESQYYQTLRSWLKNSSIPVSQKSSMEGLVRYVGLEGTDAEDFVESVGFDLILAKDNQMAMVSYGKHRFNNELIENMRGRVGYNIVIFKVQDWKDVFLMFLNRDRDQE
jgi:hypothetical protein